MASGEEPVSVASVLNLLPDAALVIDDQGFIVRVNGNAEVLFGFDSGQLAGRMIEELIPERFRKGHFGLRTAFSESPRTRSMGSGLMLWGYRNDGSEFPVDITLAHVEGSIRSLTIAIVRDMTSTLEASDARSRIEMLSDRERIARDLHDHVIQRIFATGLSLQAAMAGTVDQRTGEKITKAIEELDTTITELRSSIFNLEFDSDASHSVSEGPRARLLLTVSQASDSLGFRPSVHFTGPVDTAIPPYMLDDVIAVVREAVTNAAKHANATELNILVDAGKELVVVVVDNGCGVGDPDHFSGLTNIAVRAGNFGGTFSISNRDVGGTHLEWRVPLV